MKSPVAEPPASVTARDKLSLPAAAPAHHSLLAYWCVVGTHAVVDVFPIIIISLMIVLQQRLSLTAWQETVVWISLPIFSGGLQPLFAWLGDRYNTRLAGPLGLALGAVCIGSIGFAQSFGQLMALHIVGVIGVGMYHPAAAATAGQLGSRALRHGRAFALSLFVASGMVGHTIGPIIGTRFNAWFGMTSLAWLIPPSLVAAVVLYLTMRHAPHRPHNHHELHSSFTTAESRTRWTAAVLLSMQNSVRFTVNTAMYILFNYWAAWRIAADKDAAAILNGNLTAATTIGMGIGALISGRFFRPGTEKVAFALTAFGGAVCVALTSVAGQWGSWAACAAALLAAIGYFSTIPASVGLGQRLLPSHASLVTALLLGVGWMIGALARPLATIVLGVDSLDDAPTLTSGDFTRGFVTFGGLLAVSGVLALLMPSRAIHDAARHD